jgi:hypothetical protein
MTSSANLAYLDRVEYAKPGMALHHFYQDVVTCLRSNPGRDVGVTQPSTLKEVAKKILERHTSVKDTSSQGFLNLGDGYEAIPIPETPAWDYRLITNYQYDFGVWPG